MTHGNSQNILIEAKSSTVHASAIKIARRRVIIVIKSRTKAGKKCEALRVYRDYRVIYDAIHKTPAYVSCIYETENSGSVNVCDPSRCVLYVKVPTNSCHTQQPIINIQFTVMSFGCYI